MKGLLSIMLLLESRILAVMVVLMVFIGQANAVTVSACQINMKNQSVTQSMRMVDHSSVTVSEDDSLSAPKMSDCCDQNCACSSGNCAPAVMLPVSYDDRDVIPLQKNTAPQLLIPEQSSTSLYRPPISL